MELGDWGQSWSGGRTIPGPVLTLPWGLVAVLSGLSCPPSALQAQVGDRHCRGEPQGKACRVPGTRELAQEQQAE